MTLDIVECSTCRGSGVVPVHYRWRGVVGDGEGKCPDCDGVGSVHADGSKLRQEEVVA